MTKAILDKSGRPYLTTNGGTPSLEDSELSAAGAGESSALDVHPYDREGYESGGQASLPKKSDASIQSMPEASFKPWEAPIKSGAKGSSSVSRFRNKKPTVAETLAPYKARVSGLEAEVASMHASNQRLKQVFGEPGGRSSMATGAGLDLDFENRQFNDQTFWPHVYEREEAYRDIEAQQALDRQDQAEINAETLSADHDRATEAAEEQRTQALDEAEERERQLEALDLRDG